MAVVLNQEPLPVQLQGLAPDIIHIHYVGSRRTPDTAWTTFFISMAGMPDSDIQSSIHEAILLYLGAYALRLNLDRILWRGWSIGDYQNVSKAVDLIKPMSLVDRDRAFETGCNVCCATPSLGVTVSGLDVVVESKVCSTVPLPSIMIKTFIMASINLAIQSARLSGIPAGHTPYFIYSAIEQAFYHLLTIRAVTVAPTLDIFDNRRTWTWQDHFQYRKTCSISIDADHSGTNFVWSDRGAEYLYSPKHPLNVRGLI